MLFQDKQQRRSCLLGFAIILALLPIFALIWLSESLARLAQKRQKESDRRKSPLSDPVTFPRCTGLPQPTVNPATWRLIVGGEVEQPATFTLQDLMQMKTCKGSAPINCPGGAWVYNVSWAGTEFTEIIARVRPLESARWVRFVGADGYHECASLSRLKTCKAFLAHWLKDKPLPANHGAPVRLIYPTKYGYKAVKWLTEISFTSTRSKGYLDGKMANYDADGAIRFAPSPSPGAPPRPAH
ncbi:MAG: molybdopterin-dependent oxidoreductase [Planctomycetota bacterium]